MRWKGILVFILSIAAISISLSQFLVRDILGSKIIALMLLIFSISIFISIVKDYIKNKNKK